MLREFDAVVRVARSVRIAAAAAVLGVAVAAAGCGIKGPLRQAPPPAPAAADMGPPLPAEPIPPAPPKP